MVIRFYYVNLVPPEHDDWRERTLAPPKTKRGFHHAKHYRIYLLLAWFETGEEQLRLRLENPRTGKRYGFDNLETLFATLRTILADTEEAD
jgi:hypothetical protein